MKKILLFLLIFSTLFAKSQNCITVVSSVFTNPSGDGLHWKLTINYTANGTKNLRTIVLVNSDTAVNNCFQTSQATSTGSIVYDNILAPGGLATLRARFIRRTGTCDNGTVCDSDQIIDNNVLDIKVSNVSARNVGNTTEVTFTVLSVTENSRITLNLWMPDGKKKQKLISLPDARSGQIWKVYYNNLTDTYTTKKLY